MLGQATRTSASLPRQVPPAGPEQAETLSGTARRRLQSRIGKEAAALFDRCGRERRFVNGESLARSDELGDAVYIVLEGVVGLYSQGPTETRDVLGYCYSGDLIAPGRLGGAWGFDATALTSGKLLLLDLQELRARGEGSLAWGLLEAACAELAHRTARLRGYWFLPVKARLATFLFEMDEGIGRRSDRGIVLDLPMFRDEIATYLGTRTETVCRILTGWKDRGLIVMDSPRKLVIPDGARLRSDAFT
ncbi:MAG: Crp/Fnr family transcriptional regulator [Methyloligellaceae bacterium]